MTGWAPSPKQPRAAARGSATVSFQDLEKAMQDKNTLPEGVSEASGGPDDRGEAPPRGQATLEADDGTWALAVVLWPHPAAIVAWLPSCCHAIFPTAFDQKVHKIWEQC